MRWCACRSRLAARRHHDWSVRLEGCQKFLTAADVSRISSVTRKSRCTGLCDNASRRLFATRVSGAAQEKQLGEQKTFHKASRRGHSRAATGRGAGRAQLRGQHKHGRSRETPQQQAPPDMQIGQSSGACLCREVPADHEAHSRPQRGQLRKERVLITLDSFRRLSQSFGGSAPRRPKQET